MEKFSYHYKAMLKETSLMGGSFDCNEHFQALLAMGDSILPILAEKVIKVKGYVSWAEFQLIGMLLGPERMPEIPESARGLYYKIAKIYYNVMKEWLAQHKENK